MSRRAQEFLDDFRNNWDNSYWWVDHQWLATILLCMFLFVYEITLQYFKLVIKYKVPSPTLGD